MKAPRNICISKVPAKEHPASHLSSNLVTPTPTRPAVQSPSSMSILERTLEFQRQVQLTQAALQQALDPPVPQQSRQERTPMQQPHPQPAAVSDQLPAAFRRGLPPSMSGPLRPGWLRSAEAPSGIPVSAPKPPSAPDAPTTLPAAGPPETGAVAATAPLAQAQAVGTGRRCHVCRVWTGSPQRLRDPMCPLVACSLNCLHRLNGQDKTEED